MDEIFRALLPVLLAAVAVVLVLGLWNMMRGSNPGRSQTLMRWRVVLQFIAIMHRDGGDLFRRIDRPTAAGERDIFSALPRKSASVKSRKI